ncbi:hypothetical protein Tco_0316572 [Tanacetum coccineum]
MMDSNAGNKTVRDGQLEFADFVAVDKRQSRLPSLFIQLRNPFMSADSAVTYTSVHSETRSWSIPSEDPYEEVAQQLAAIRQMRAAALSTYHSLLTSGTPPLLPIPLPAPSTSHRANIPEADMPPRKRLLYTTPRPRCEVGESSAAAAER